VFAGGGAAQTANIQREEVGIASYHADHQQDGYITTVIGPKSVRC
jgi:hypothetical protein